MPIGTGTICAIVGGAGVALGLAAGILPVLGFGAAGVKAGFPAAAAQAAIGNVPAGGLFAVLQQAGVLGFAAGQKVAIGAIGGAAGVFVKNRWKSSEEE